MPFVSGNIFLKEIYERQSSSNVLLSKYQLGYTPREGRTLVFKHDHLPLQSLGTMVIFYFLLLASQLTSNLICTTVNAVPKLFTDLAYSATDLRYLGAYDIITLCEIAITGLPGLPIDDKTALIEKSRRILAKLPAESGLLRSVEGLFLHKLWLQRYRAISLSTARCVAEMDALQPASRGDCVTAKSSNSSYISVTTKSWSETDLPSPEAVFDGLMARGKRFYPHPGKISSALFHLATIITHDIFRTVWYSDPGFQPIDVH